MSPALDTYQEYLSRKRIYSEPCGFTVSDADINPMLFPFQRDIVRWACHRGKAAVFAHTGLGKGPVQLEWCRLVSRHTNGTTLILAPLAVSQQFVREAAKFHIPLTLCKSQADVQPGINVTNYERTDLFDLESFAGVALDESSCIKDWTSKTTAGLIDRLRNTPYKLCSTATPSPNDHAELGTHAELLDVMRRSAILAMFFEHDGGETSKWSLKGHGKKPFWKFVASWAVCLNKPSDLGYDDSLYILPRLHTIEHIVPVDHSINTDGMLFRSPDLSATGLHKELRLTCEARAVKVAELVGEKPGVPWLIWCGTNYEADAVRAALPGTVEVRGSDTQERKESMILHFLDSPNDWLVSKTSIFGFGLNLQSCRNMAFMGIGYSFEQFFQGVRRCWRFGQTEEVYAHIVIAETEGAVLSSIRRKEAQYEELQAEMNEAMREEQLAARHKSAKYDHLTDMMLPDCFETEGSTVKVINQVISDEYAVYHADCVEMMRGIPSESIHMSISSPPFGSLYSYTDALQDLSNVRTDAEFIEGMEFMVAEMFRILLPGRICAFHCMNLPSSIERDGFIGIRDFRGDLIRMYQRHGFIYHSEVVIWKDPLVAATRTHAIGLAHKQIVSDSTICRTGIPDYLVAMRKPGKNPEPVSPGTNGFQRWIGAPEDEPKADKKKDARTNKYSHLVWQKYASPVWFDINPSDTLQKESAREDDDSRHICPLQLTVIRRAIELWSNPGDIVFDPFTGIGSSGYVALEEGRCFLGSELKESYWRQAVGNLEAAIKLRNQGTLYGN